MDNVASENAATEKLVVFAVVTVEAVFSPPVQTRQHIEPVFVAAAQEPSRIGRAGTSPCDGGEKRAVEVGLGITARNVDQKRIPRQVTQATAGRPSPIHLFVAADTATNARRRYVALE